MEARHIPYNSVFFKCSRLLGAHLFLSAYFPRINRNTYCRLGAWPFYTAKLAHLRFGRIHVVVEVSKNVTVPNYDT